MITKNLFLITDEELLIQLAKVLKKELLKEGKKGKNCILKYYTADTCTVVTAPT